VTRFVGLTGGIGAGKSTALAALERLGVPVLSTDQVVHDLYETDEVKSAVTERFGDSVLADGSVNRPVLAERAFATAEDRAWLEALLWPLVAQRMNAWRTELERLSPSPRVAVVEVPLLFESGLEGAFDATIALTADEALRTERATARGHRSLQERAARQLTQQEKAQRATYVIANDGTVGDLEVKLLTVLEKLQR
jgi:dephospho-CoA kinase